MDFTGILDILVKILAVVFVGLFSVLMPKIEALLQQKIGTEKSNTLIKLVKTLVTSAEQMYKEKDPTGEERNKYVKEQLKALGYEITDEINALIEASVFSLNK